MLRVHSDKAPFPVLFPFQLFKSMSKEVKITRSGEGKGWLAVRESIDLLMSRVFDGETNIILLGKFEARSDIADSSDIYGIACQVS